MTQTGMVAGGALTDWISLGVLASAVPRDAVDDAVEAAGKSAKRSGGKLPPHVMVYFAMAMALYGEDDYEEIIARLSETLRGWGSWDDAWEVPTPGRDHPGAAAAGLRAAAGAVCRGGGTGRRSGHRGGVPRPVAADDHRRVRVGRPGQQGERRRVRVRGDRWRR